MCNNVWRRSISAALAMIALAAAARMGWADRSAVQMLLWVIPVMVVISLAEDRRGRRDCSPSAGGQ